MGSFYFETKFNFHKNKSDDLSFLKKKDDLSLKAPQIVPELAPILNPNSPEWKIIGKLHSESPPLVPSMPLIIKSTELNSESSKWEVSNIKNRITTIQDLLSNTDNKSEVKPKKP